MIGGVVVRVPIKPDEVAEKGKLKYSTQMPNSWYYMYVITLSSGKETKE